jgi:hypothetical protein
MKTSRPSSPQKLKKLSQACGIADALELLEDYQPSAFFSADRYYSRKLQEYENHTIQLNTENREKITASKELFTPHPLEILHFNTLVEENKHDVTAEAKTLLTDWMNKPLELTSEESRSVTREILFDLGLSGSLNDQLERILDQKVASSCLNESFTSLLYEKVRSLE